MWNEYNDAVPRRSTLALGEVVPVDVSWEEQDWEANPSGPVESRVLDLVPDDQLVLERLFEALETKDLPNLGFINPATVTVFHQQHLDALLNEMKTVKQRYLEKKVATHLEAVTRLIVGAHGIEDTFIVFQARGFHPRSA